MKINLEAIVKTSLGVWLVSMMAGCADINGSIKNINETLYQTQNTFSGVYEQNISKVIAPLPSKKAVQNISQAYDVMQKSLSIIACAKKNNQKYYRQMLNQYSIRDGMTPQFTLPIHDDIKKHHDGCLEIKKIFKYEELEEDKFRFSVIYVSNQSGESAQKTYEMQKMSGNEWYYSRFSL